MSSFGDKEDAFNISMIPNSLEIKITLTAKHINSEPADVMSVRFI